MLISYRKIMGLIAAVYLALILIAVLPIGWGWYTSAYSYLVVYGVSLPLIGVLAYLIIARSDRRFVLTGKVLKALMVVGLLAFLLGRK